MRVRYAIAEPGRLPQVTIRSAGITAESSGTTYRSDTSGKVICIPAWERTGVVSEVRIDSASEYIKFVIWTVLRLRSSGFSSANHRRITLIQRDGVSAGLQVDSDVPNEMVRVGCVGHNVKGSQTRHVVKSHRAAMIESRSRDDVIT